MREGQGKAVERGKSQCYDRVIGRDEVTQRIQIKVRRGDVISGAAYLAYMVSAGKSQAERKSSARKLKPTPLLYRNSNLGGDEAMIE